MHIITVFQYLSFYNLITNFPENINIILYFNSMFIYLTKQNLDQVDAKSEV